ncbi:unnamed protein product [Arctia plantaginis]|uniref:Uncharacterized protein n=1 Tax=Arctia plantaginis TaxID=874455 RepID=A0A8S0ZEV1_ARCPL|nr:unnamed protein product [Arctia plantaginis]
MSTNHDINIKNYSKLSSFLKRQFAGHKSKKSKVFTAQDVKTFINEAPDDIYLAVKVVLILGITGACRGIEFTTITIENIEQQGQLLVIKLPNTKTKIDRTFIVP